MLNVVIKTKGGHKEGMGDVCSAIALGSEFKSLRHNVLYPIDNSISDFQYVLLSSVYQQKHKLSMVIKDQVNNIIVAQWGSDTYGFTPKIADALSGLPEDIEIKIVLGPNYSHINELNEVLESSSRAFNIVTGLGDLSDMMLGTDLAETRYLSLPVL